MTNPYLRKMRYKTKSIIIGRKKRKSKSEEYHPCFIALFDINDPHKSTKVPKKILDYEKTFRVFIDGFNVKYMLPGNDIVVNNLDYVDIGLKGKDIFVKGKQKK